MAHEAPPEEIIALKDESKTFQNLSNFCSQQAFADIVLNLNGQKIYAHKVVLAAGSTFFQKLLLNNPNRNEYEITMPDASQEAFQKVIEYIYKGTISVSSCDGNVLFDLLILSKKFSLERLEKMMSEKMAIFLDITNVFALLNKANKYNMNNLIEVCHHFIDIHAWDCLKTNSIYRLTEKAVVKLLERDSFALPEIEVFKIVSKWCQINKNKSIIQCVRLCNLSNDEILKTVWPSKLIEDGKLLGILSEFNDGKSKAPQHRARSIFDRNLATQEYRAKVISGSNTSWLLSDNDDPTKCASHPINDGNGITVDLGAQCYFNHIKMRLAEDSSYHIESSLDKEKWENILDYKMYECRSYQNLYFETKLARYVRVVGTHASQSMQNYNRSGGQNFKLVHLKIYYKEQIPRVVEQVVCPFENVATEEMGAFVSEPYSQNSGYGSSYGYSNLPNETITVQLGQPYMISVMRLMVCGVANYTYRIDTSSVKQNSARRNTTCTSSNQAKGEEWKEISINPEPINSITIYFSNLQRNSNSSSNRVQRDPFNCNMNRVEHTVGNRLKSGNILSTQSGLQAIPFYRQSNPVLYFECFIKNNDVDKAKTKLKAQSPIKKPINTNYYHDDYDQFYM